MRLRGVSLALTMLLVSGLALSQESGLGEQISLQGNGSGAAPCSSCHGADGGGMAGTTFPRLAGLNAQYLRNQLKAFQEGTRHDPVMVGNAAALSDEEITAVTDYYSGLAAPEATGTATDPELLERGRFIAERGNWDRYVPACQSCHGPDGIGVSADFPPLAGQVAGYTEQQFAYWRAGVRSNDPLGMMEAVAVRLSEEDVAAVAAWYSTVNPPVITGGE